ncbi:hypothetical protein [Paraburkholderia strydomiana]|uniref:hypothetical protein n=1 Tax=Paraburkholderia strydomiana TaxID=1245417 RepID=UPI0038B94468
MASNLRDEVSPMAGKRAAVNFYTLTQRCHSRRMTRPLYAEPRVKHVLGRGHQLNINLKSATFSPFSAYCSFTFRNAARTIASQTLNRNDVALCRVFQLLCRGLHRRWQIAQCELGDNTVQAPAKLNREIHDTGVADTPAIALSGTNQ